MCVFQSGLATQANARADGSAEAVSTEGKQAEAAASSSKLVGGCVGLQGAGGGWRVYGRMVDRDGGGCDPTPLCLGSIPPPRQAGMHVLGLRSRPPAAARSSPPPLPPPVAVRISARAHHSSSRPRLITTPRNALILSCHSSTVHFRSTAVSGHSQGVQWPASDLCTLLHWLLTFWLRCSFLSSAKQFFLE